MVKAHPPYSKRMRLFMQRKDRLGRKNVTLGVIGATFISIGLVGWCEPYEDVNWCDVSSSWVTPTESRLTFVDLFCGAGGLSKGLEFAGLNPTFLIIGKLEKVSDRTCGLSASFGNIAA